MPISLSSCIGIGGKRLNLLLSLEDVVHNRYQDFRPYLSYSRRGARRIVRNGVNKSCHHRGGNQKKDCSGKDLHRLSTRVDSRNYI